MAYPLAHRYRLAYQLAGAEDATPQIRSFGPRSTLTAMGQDKTARAMQAVFRWLRDNGGVWIAIDGFLLSGGGGMRHPGVRSGVAPTVQGQGCRGVRTWVLARMPSTTWRSVSGPTASKKETRSPVSATTSTRI